MAFRSGAEREGSGEEVEGRRRLRAQVYGGDNAYDAEVTQEDGSTKTQKIDEVADVLRLTTGALPPGKGIRLNGEKFMVLRPLDKATYQAKVTNYEGEEESHPVTLDAVHMLKKGTIGCIIVEKGGYIFLAFCDNSKPEQQPPAAASALAIGIYWSVGPDAKDE